MEKKQRTHILRKGKTVNKLNLGKAKVQTLTVSAQTSKKRSAAFDKSR